MKILLKLAYTGDNYCGFQSQKNGRSVQETLTAACRQVFGIPCLVTGCSRTDSGVHAYGFVASVEPERLTDGWCTVPTGRIHRAVNAFLPDDIAITAAAEADDGFHVRYSAHEKKYVYKMYAARARNPFYEKRAYHLTLPIFPADAAAKMNLAAKGFIGYHDFTSFMAQGSRITDCRRHVTDAGVTMNGDIIEFFVSADGFLYNMVRIMAGTLLNAVGNAKAEIPEIIAALDRSAAGATLPPYGLYLDSVTYDKSLEWLCE